MSQLLPPDCYRVSVLDRTRALQILGLSERADEGEIRSAYRALRAHVEARSKASDQETFREERRNELRDLERALRSLGSIPTPPGFIESSPRSQARKLVPRWVLGWAIAATILTFAAWITYLSTREGVFGPAVLVAGSGDGGEGSGGFAIDGEGEEGDREGGSGDVASAGERAKLVAKSPVGGATLEVWTRGEAAELVAEGAADETVYWLTPGEYALRVAHEDCEGAWERDLEARGGEEHTFEPEPCEDVGWVVVQSNVAEDELTIDGERVGATGAEQHPLSAGEHEVRVAKPGYQAWEGIVDVQPGRVLGLRPRLESVAKAAQTPRPQSPAVAADAPRNRDPALDESWHEQARQWLLSRYDLDRSGALDSKEELESVPCDFWLGLEASHSQSRLGLTLTRFYGFDGKGWRSGALGAADEIRDLAYERMTHCGLR
jgi:hypothetical protein